MTPCLLCRNNVAYDAMAATSPAAYLWFVAIIVMGNYILLNLFLAILLDNFGSGGANGGASTANSTGGTLAAAAKAAQMMAWMQDLLDVSWFARMLQRRNRVAALRDSSEDDAITAPAPALPSSQHDGQAAPSAVLQEGVAGSTGARSPALLLDHCSAVGESSLAPAPGQRSSVAGGYPQAAARRR
jgi:hypothetical protein